MKGREKGTYREIVPKCNIFGILYAPWGYTRAIHFRKFFARATFASQIVCLSGVFYDAVR